MAIERELGWDDAIENDGPSYSFLPDGEYPFTVQGFERKRYAGGAKLPACNMAELKLMITNPADGSAALCSHRLYLHTRTEGLLCAFFTSIGQRRHGEKLVPNWGRVVGASGRCELGHYTSSRDGKDYNEVKRFLEPAADAATWSEQPRGDVPAAWQAGTF